MFIDCATGGPSRSLAFALPQVARIEPPGAAQSAAPVISSAKSGTARPRVSRASAASAHLGVTRNRALFHAQVG